MSLIHDYLEKTTPEAKTGPEGQVPPMLRQEKKKPRNRLARLLPTLVLLFVVLSFSGYVFKASFHSVTASPEKINSEKTPVQTIPARQELSQPRQIAQNSLPGKNIKPLNNQSIIKEQTQAPRPESPEPEVSKPGTSKKEKPEELPVDEPVMESALAFQTKAPQSQVVQQEEPQKEEQAHTIQKIQMAMEGKPQETVEKQDNLETEKPGQNIPAGPEDYFNLGLAAQKAGNLKRATAFYRKALVMNPLHSKALLNLSFIHIKTGNDPRAMAILEKLYAREPQNMDALVNLGILHLRAKNFDKAQDIFEKALGIEGNNTKILFNLAYLNQVQNRMEQARELYTRVFSLDRENTKAFLAAASILEKQKKFSQALGCYAQALNTAEVKASGSFELKIHNRIRLLQKIGADADKKMEKKI